MELVERRDCENLVRSLAEERAQLLNLSIQQHEHFKTCLELTFGKLDQTFRGSVSSLPVQLGTLRSTAPPVLPEDSDPVPANPFTAVALGLKTMVSEESFPTKSPLFPTTLNSCTIPVPEMEKVDSDNTVDGQPVDQTFSSKKALPVSPNGSRKPTHLRKLMTRSVDDVWIQKAKSFLDYFAGFMVVLNTMSMILELELQGTVIGIELGIEEGQVDNSAMDAFRTLDKVFVFIFLAEWILRLVFERMDFCRDYANIFDTCLVVSSLVDLYFSLITGSDDGTPKGVVILRMMRALKALRAIRVVRSLRFFGGLRVLVKACTCFLPSLCWAMVLLGIFMSMGALMLGNLLQSYMTDVSLPLDNRLWLWDRYGTAYRATYTLFEITFAGNWPTSARPVLEKANHVFVIFLVLYVTVVVFAVIRVITAIFLKETFDAAQNDAEHLVKDRLKMKAQYISKLESVFMAIDETGDGMITEERLNQILARPEVAAYFQTLEIDVHEGTALFHLLDNGDGEVTLEEFIDGIMRCKGQARAIDQVALHAEMKQLDSKINKLIEALNRESLLPSMSSSSSRMTEKRKEHKIRTTPTQAELLKVFRLDTSDELLSVSPFQRSTSPGFTAGLP
ncbi:Voltage-dependent T-type calcium channel subunit alpha-1I (CaVT.3) (Voltage-gated calcium channel subunit alpha Cav3.3) [Durusdinium trenchii]|uniref:Voltage-dependent T-type calcium channel subunit alpha-1I (CaVT.3) (Voltage-gated calcium channel subunit alpha Cav3.3) n=2 Tax=Durusdinium trenchii TaxID=1381693 RepID=A0ABP0N9C9_9DINO